MILRLHVYLMKNYSNIHILYTVLITVVRFEMSLSHGQFILARTARLEERRSLMKAKLMYKTVNQLVPQRLCHIFQFSNTVNSYNLRGSSTGLFKFQGPEQNC